MHSVIVGCGRVGAELAAAFEARTFTVSIIDKDPRRFEQRLLPGFHGQTFVGLAFDREVLEAAGIKDADVFVAATNGDNSNIVSARVAKEHYEVPQVAALIYDPRRAQIYERLGISTVATVAWTTDQILARVLATPELVEWTVGSGEVVIFGLPAPTKLVGKPVFDISDPSKLRVVAVTRFGQTQVPDRKTLVQEGDFLHLSALRTALGDIRKHLESPEE